MSRRRDARRKAKKWLRKAKDKFNMSGKQVRRLMRKAGVKDLDSRNDIRTMNRYLKEQNKPDPTPDPKSDPKPDPTPTPTPTTPTPTPTQDGVDYKALYERQRKDYDSLQGDLRSATGDLGRYAGQISGFQNQISGYKNEIGRLTGLYEGAVKGNKTITAERDDLQKRFDAQTAEYEQAKSDADTYRERSVGQQLAAIRGGATTGGANQTSYAGGDLASGRTGYSSSKQDRDKGLADYVVEQGGATDSVLNREGPVVQLMDRRARRASRRRNRGQARSMTSGAGTGSYYASRFGG